VALRWTSAVSRSSAGTISSEHDKCRRQIRIKTESFAFRPAILSVVAIEIRFQDHAGFLEYPFRPVADKAMPIRGSAAGINLPETWYNIHLPRRCNKIRPKAGVLPPRLASIAFSRRSGSEPVSCSEDPPRCRQAQDQEGHGHAEAYANAHIRAPVEAPTEPVDQIDNGIGQRDRSPDGG
jgi:hypothetical protein